MKNRKHCTIIGSGIAGSVLSRRLADRFDLTVLEAGPRSGIRYPNFVTTARKLADINTFCHASGGGTNLWHNGLVPLRPGDVLSPEFAAALEDAHTFTDQTANILHFSPGSFATEFDHLSKEVEDLGGQIGSFDDGIDCLVYPKSVSPLPVPQFVTGYFDVDSLEFRASNKSISGVSFRSDGSSFSIETDMVVISAGSFGTPRVLNRVFESLEEENSGIGHGLIDHPMGFVGKYRFPPLVAKAVGKFALLDKAGYESRNMIRLRSDCGNYTGCAFFRPVLTSGNSLKVYKYKSLLGASIGRKRLRNAVSPLIVHPDIVSEIVSHLSGLQIPTRTYSVLFVGEQRRGRNRVFDKEGTLHVDWTISAEELQIYSGMIKKLHSMLSDSAEESDVCFDPTGEWLWSAAHHSGTTSMGSNPTDIVDRNLRVRCSDNVFVCDASVIQEHSYANTGLTIGQFSSRLAAYLSDTYSK